MIDIATLKEYIKVFEESGLCGMEISDEANTLRLERPYGVEQPSNVKVYSAPDGPVAVYTGADETSQAPAPSGKTIKAPIVGVFYVAPSPESEPYAPIGKKVKKGDTVCIIEAMKCMNEIQAEEDGEIVEVLANDGELVEYGQPLFRIK